MIERLYKYEIETTKKGNRLYKKYTFTFLVEFKTDSTREFLEKAKVYMINSNKVHLAEQEKDGNFYVYLRRKKYLLNKGVTII